METTEMQPRTSGALQWYLQELASQIVAESGIPNDRYHLGKLMLKCFRDTPDFIMQINGATNDKDTFESAMIRSIRCACAFRKLGLKHNDIIIIMAPNYLDLTMPLYAALYLGIGVAGIDMNLGVNELQDKLKYTLPKAIFCENSNVHVVQEAVNMLNMSTHIITFGEKLDHMSFTEFLDTYSDTAAVDSFRPADFDPTETPAFLVATSGTTGLPKCAILTHTNVYIGFTSSFISIFSIPTLFEISVVVSPIQWITALFQFIMSPIIRFTRVQSPLSLTPDHVCDLINKYKPEFTVMSPTFMTTLIKTAERNQSDFGSFKLLLIGGSAVTKELLLEIKKVAPDALTKSSYGMSETSGMLSNPIYARIESVGMPMNTMEFKLVDTLTREIINEPNIPGELYVKGPNVSKGYYNNPEITAQAFEDGWLKTGDILYRDDTYQFYYVDRLKSLLKYRNHQVSPVEIESVVIKHPGVSDVAVAGIPDDECGDLPVAFVVQHRDGAVTEQDIIHLVKESLTDTKQLRGGVVFLEKLPLTATGKIDRQTLKKMAADLRKK